MCVCVCLCLFCVSLCVFVFLCLCVSLSVSLLFLCVSVCLCVCLCVCVSLCLCVAVAVWRCAGVGGEGCGCVGCVRVCSSVWVRGCGSCRQSKSRSVKASSPLEGHVSCFGVKLCQKLIPEPSLSTQRASERTQDNLLPYVVLPELVVDFSDFP